MGYFNNFQLVWFSRGRSLIQEAVPKIKSLQNRFEPVSVIGELGAFSGQTKFWGPLVDEFCNYFVTPHALVSFGI